MTSKGLSVDHQNKVARFGESFGTNASLWYNTRSGTWLPDDNQIILKCENRTVGVCDFDLVMMINKKSGLLRANIQPQSYQRRDESEYVLLGDTQEFPGAYVEFKVKVSPPKGNDNRMSTMNRTTSQQPTRGIASMDENVQR